MGIYSWIKELPAGTFVLPITSDLRDRSERKGVESEKWRTAVFFRSTFEGIDEYAYTIPTGPSAGRIYRRPARDERGPNQSYVKVVYDDPVMGDQIHIPYKVHIIEGH